MKSIYLTYKFGVVEYYPFGKKKVVYDLDYDYKVEIDITDIIQYYFEPCDSDTRLSVLKTLSKMDLYGLINYEPLESDSEFIDFLKNKNEQHAYCKLQNELEKGEEESL